MAGRYTLVKFLYILPHSLSNFIIKCKIYICFAGLLIKGHSFQIEGRRQAGPDSMANMFESLYNFARIDKSPNRSSNMKIISAYCAFGYRCCQHYGSYYILLL